MRKIRAAGARIPSAIRTERMGHKPSHLGAPRPPATTVTTLTKMATPPSRGTELPWMWRPGSGARTHPRTTAKLRMYLVSRAETSKLMTKAVRRQRNKEGPLVMVVPEADGQLTQEQQIS